MLFLWFAMCCPFWGRLGESSAACSRDHAFVRNHPARRQPKHSQPISRWLRSTLPLHTHHLFSIILHHKSSTWERLHLVDTLIYVWITLTCLWHILLCASQQGMTLPSICFSWGPLLFMMVAWEAGGVAGETQFRISALNVNDSVCGGGASYASSHLQVVGPTSLKNQYNLILYLLTYWFCVNISSKMRSNWLVGCCCKFFITAMSWKTLLSGLSQSALDQLASGW